MLRDAVEWRSFLIVCLSERSGNPLVTCVCWSLCYVVLGIPRYVGRSWCVNVLFCCVNAMSVVCVGFRARMRSEYSLVSCVWWALCHVFLGIPRYVGRWWGCWLFVKSVVFVDYLARITVSVSRFLSGVREFILHCFGNKNSTIVHLQTVSNIRLPNGGRCKRPRRMPIFSIPSLT